jgi:hypothetical protein
MPGITAEQRCPKCSGEMWDNRTTKKNPKQPDYACKNREGCGHAIWPPKEKPSGGAPAQKAPAVPLETLSAEYGSLLRSVAKALATTAEGLPERMKPTFADAQSASATIWIQYRRQA